MGSAAPQEVLHQPSTDEDIRHKNEPQRMICMSLLTSEIINDYLDCAFYFNGCGKM